MTTTKFQSQWFAVEMEAMGTLSLMGATSVQYRKLAPRKPMGTKKLKAKMKKAAAPMALVFSSEKLVETARANMQLDMPKPEKMKSARRPKRSIVKKATKQDKNFQVKQAPVRTRASSGLIPRLSWKRMVA
jgi:hypothetical protein